MSQSSESGSFSQGSSRSSQPPSHPSSDGSGSAPGSASGSGSISGPYNGNQNTVTTRNGRSIRISHRRTPSELTPLMQENLALQQQIEMLQAQQQMLAQQQYAAAGLMPPPPGVYQQVGSPGMVGMPQLAVPPMPYGYHGAGPVLPPVGLVQDTHHARTRSAGGPAANAMGHARRHSLAVSEARKAAQVEQARRAETDSDTGGSRAGSSGAEPLLPPPGGPGPVVDTTDSSTGAFRFPPSPERRHSRTNSTHQRSTPSPVRNQFQFPAQTFTPSGRHQHQGSQHQHRRSNSRNLDSNWRQPPPSDEPTGLAAAGLADKLGSTHLSIPTPSFVPGHHHRGGSYSSVSSIAAFTESAQNPSQAGRKSLFVPYLSQATIPQLLAEGLLVAGTLRVNRKNRSDAYVSTNVLDADIFICGSKDRNRALEGDLVAVELLDVNDVWDSKREKEEKKRRRDANDDSRLVETASGELRRKGSLKQRPTQKRNDDVEVEGQTLLLKEEEQHTDGTRPLYAGHIVAILERPGGQLFSGTLGLLRPSSQATKERQDAERAEKGQPPLAAHKPDRPKIVWFKPTDKCVPLMAIPTEQVPKDFVENHVAYGDKIFVSSIKRWPITSLHPFGTLVEELGDAGDTEVEIKAVLRDNNFGRHRFSNTAQQILEEVASRSAEWIESEDREHISDSSVAIEVVEGLVEQAFSCKKLDNGNVELSVHTLDVTPYFTEESALDRELRHKSAGVYMRQYASPLIPSKIVSKITLDAGKKSPALTVSFELDRETFEVLETPTVRETVIEPEAVTNVEKIEREHGNLYSILKKIAGAFRKQREAYAPGIDQYLEVRAPVKKRMFDHDEDSAVFLELNHKVNATIAQKLLAEYGGAALLQRQPDPPIMKMESLSQVLRSAGVSIDTSSASSVGKSISKISDPQVRLAVDIALFKALPAPKYVAGGRVDPLSLGHYWLNFPAYTHFNAPLRRYADLVVHRQIHAVIRGERGSVEDEQRVTNLCSELSFLYECAKNVQEQSIHLALSQQIAELSEDTGYILRTGVVIQVFESAFDVYIPDLGIEKRIHGDQLPLVKAEFLKKEHALELYWDASKDAATYAPAGNSSTPKSKTTAEIAAETSVESLAPLLKLLELREADGSYVQTIRALTKVPVLVRVDIGVRVLPSISVRTINPFYKS